MKSLLLLIIFTLLLSSNCNAEVYRVNIDLSFDNQQDAQNVITFIENNKAKITHKISSSPQPTLQVIKSASYHTCRHDETPPQQCSDYVYANLN